MKIVKPPQQLPPPPPGPLIAISSASLLRPSSGLSGRWRSGTCSLHKSSLLVFFQVWFSSNIGEVVATMTLGIRSLQPIPNLTTSDPAQTKGQ